MRLGKPGASLNTQKRHEITNCFSFNISTESAPKQVRYISRDVRLLLSMYVVPSLFVFAFEKLIFWYWSYYPHMLRDLLFPVCRIFFLYWFYYPQTSTALLGSRKRDFCCFEGNVPVFECLEFFFGIYIYNISVSSPPTRDWSKGDPHTYWGNSKVISCPCRKLSWFLVSVPSGVTRSSSQLLAASSCLVVRSEEMI